MDWFLFMALASGACGFGAVVTKKLAHSREHERQSQRRKQLLIQTLQEGQSDLPMARVSRFSGRRLKMELLLGQLSASAEMLTGALTAAAQCGRQAIRTDSETAVYLREMQEARRAVEQAQEDYNEALSAYHEFLHTLPPPLRTKAAERGSLVMATMTA